MYRETFKMNKAVVNTCSHSTFRIMDEDGALEVLVTPSDDHTAGLQTADWYIVQMLRHAMTDERSQHLPLLSTNQSTR